MIANKKFNLIFIFLLISIHCFSQKRVSLNRHFFEIDPKSNETPIYTRIENQSPTGETVVWIFDLENRMISQSKIGPHPEETFNQEITERFDSLTHRISQTITNLDNSKYLTAFYEMGVKKAEVFRKDENSFEIWRRNPDAAYSKEYDDFKPSFDPTILNSFFAKHLTYPLSARRSGSQGIAIVAVLISAEGKPIEFELANGIQIHSDLGSEALRVINRFPGPYRPALDLEGNPIEAWLYIPVRFKLG